GIMDKPGLPWAAARETAIFAVMRGDEWQHLPPAEAIERLRKHHKGIWDDKARRGTAVHELAHEWARGNEIDVPPGCAPYIDGLAQFYADWRPSWVALERSVIYDHGYLSYGGSFDAIGDLADGQRWLLDLKTGSACYPDTSLQLAAYRHADAMGVYDVKGDLVATHPMPVVDACGVLHLRDDGTYSLIPMEAGPDQFEFFLHARRLWAWGRASKKVMGEPLAAPSREAVSV
ncbi:hypothetical protein, partial [Iamia sp.]|uniref:hypothetical protein n=1 Tax=Iamia sp. TaxID=2722710 RepID=UPI002BEDD6C2